MALNFNRPVEPQGSAIAATPQSNTSLEVKPYDIMADREEVVTQLAGSDEIEALTATRIQQDAADFGQDHGPVQYRRDS